MARDYGRHVQNSFLVRVTVVENMMTNSDRYVVVHEFHTDPKDCSFFCLCVDWQVYVNVSANPMRETSHG